MCRTRALPSRRKGSLIFAVRYPPRRMRSMTRFLITSAIPYVNGVKHLGNLAGSLLPADVHARFRRQTGADVLFICGTDGHGTPTELSAAAPDQDISAHFNARQDLPSQLYTRTVQ